MITKRIDPCVVGLLVSLLVQIISAIIASNYLHGEFAKLTSTSANCERAMCQVNRIKTIIAPEFVDDLGDECDQKPARPNNQNNRTIIKPRRAIPDQLLRPLKPPNQLTEPIPDASVSHSDHYSSGSNPGTGVPSSSQLTSRAMSSASTLVKSPSTTVSPVEAK